MVPIVLRDPVHVRATLRAAALALALVSAGGCATADKYMPTWRSFGVYKMDVNQGNYLSQDMVDKLKVGMTQPQVKQVLGTPLVSSPFRADRWDYVYEYTRQGQVIEHRTFTVWFADSKLARWEGDALPETVLDLNRAASAKALPSNAPGEKSAWDRLLDVFRN